LLKPLREVAARHFHGNPVGVGRHGASDIVYFQRAMGSTPSAVGHHGPKEYVVSSLPEVYRADLPVVQILPTAPRSQKVNLASFATVSSGLQDLCSASILHIVFGKRLAGREACWSQPVARGAQEIGYGTILSQGCSSLMVVGSWRRRWFWHGSSPRAVGGQGQTGHLRDRRCPSRTRGDRSRFGTTSRYFS